MAQLVENIQQSLKNSAQSGLLLTAKVMTGLFLGLTLTLILQEILGYGNLLFVFTILMGTVAFFRISKDWSWKVLLTFNLICVLLGLLLRLYILIAPGA